MKRYICLMALLAATVAMQAQDTVRESDPWYMFMYHGDYDHNCNHASNNARAKAPWHHLYKNYGKSDSIDVYGVALTGNGLMTLEDVVRTTVDTSDLWMMPSVALFRQVTPAVIGTETTLPVAPTIEFVDSTNVFGTMKKSLFEYTPKDGEGGDIRCHLYPNSMEFYFSHPHRFSPSDTFYVSFWWPYERYIRYHYWCYPNGRPDSVAHPDTIDFWIMHEFELEGDFLYWESNYFSTINVTYYYFDDTGRMYWGLVFPIVKLRCTRPRLELVGRDSTSVSVRWTTPEAGEVYQVSLGPYGFNPDSGMLVTTVDTSHTFTGLSPNTSYAIQVRKACRYTTDGYDTLVWSDWSRVLGVVMPQVGLPEVSDGHVAVTVQEGSVVVSGLAAGERAEVYDMKGIQTAVLTTDGRTAPLPQGVYMVTLYTHAGLSYKRLVVAR